VAIFGPLHYLALLEPKTRALDQAALLAGWQLPECFATDVGTLSFVATITNLGSETVYLNGDTLTASSPLVSDDTPFWSNFVEPLGSGDSATTELFTITIPGGTSFGLCTGSFVLLGGADDLSQFQLGSADYNVNVAANVNVTPEPCAFLFMGAGLLGFIVKTDDSETPPQRKSSKRIAKPIRIRFVAVTGDTRPNCKVAACVRYSKLASAPMTTAQRAQMRETACNGRHTRSSKSRETARKTKPVAVAGLDSAKLETSRLKVSGSNSHPATSAEEIARTAYPGRRTP
jgi:hypothetical protein